jgi:hypothetical protein
MRTVPGSFACNLDQMPIVSKDLLAGTSEIGMIPLHHVRLPLRRYAACFLRLLHAPKGHHHKNY